MCGEGFVRFKGGSSAACGGNLGGWDLNGLSRQVYPRVCGACARSGGLKCSRGKGLKQVGVGVGPRGVCVSVQIFGGPTVVGAPVGFSIIRWCSCEVLRFTDKST